MDVAKVADADRGQNRDFRTRFWIPDRILAGPGSDFVDDGKWKMSILGIFGCCQDRARDRGRNPSISDGILDLDPDFENLDWNFGPRGFQKGLEK